MEAPGLMKRCAFPILLALPLLLVAAGQSRAAGVKLDVIPTLRLEEGYHTNVYDSAHDEVDSFGTRVAPGLALRFTAPDEVKLQFSGSYERTWYHASDAEDADDKTWNLRVESSGAWRFTPSFSVTPSAYYLRTPDSFRRVQLLPAGDPTLPPVSIINYGTEKTDEFGGGLNMEYTPSPNWIIGVGGNYSRQQFPDDNTASGLTDATQYGGSFSVQYAVSPRSKLGLGASMTHNTYQDSDSTDSYYLGVRFGYQITQVFRFDASVGASQIRENAEAGQPERKDTTPSGSFSFTYRTEESVARFFGSAVYTGASGYGEASRQYTVGINFTNYLSREWAWLLNAYYQKNDSVFTEEAIDIDSINGRVGIRYMPLDWFAIDMHVGADWQDSNGVYGDTIESFSAVLGFTLGKSVNIY